MEKYELLIIADYSADSLLGFEELCEKYGISAEYIHALIDYDIIHPKGDVTEKWVFDITDLRRINTALRLQHDLEVNIAGVALVLDLMDELEKLRAHMALMEKHYAGKS